jgi:hypothetical protein
MSHTTTIGTVAITDIAALRAAVQDLKNSGVQCELAEKTTPRMYFRHQEVQCDYVLKLPMAKYDVGFQKQENGTYLPITDLYGQSVAGQLGASCPMPNSEAGRAQHAVGKLMQGYARHAATNAARAKGYTVERSWTDAEGNTQLVLAVN